jgi:ATP-dependent RNA helicase DDX19/DBP5
VILQEGFENLIAQAPNGSGKTATFIIGSLSRVDLQNPKVQVVCIGHTIELTNQLFHEYEKFTTRIGIKMTMLNKEARLEDIGQVLVTLPGSFSKLLKKKCDFSSLKAFVVDEADHLLDSKNSAEFYNSLNYAIQSSVIPKSAQFLLFSATFNEEIKTDIVKLLREMNEITIKKEELMLDLIKHLYFRCDQQQKITTFEQILKRVNTGIAVSFVNTCDFANRVYNKVQNSGHKAALLMGRDMTVDERNLTMQDFREGRYSVLITTNLLARGIDNTKVNCVVNFDLPRIIRSKEMDYVLYLHRSGRCSRFGRSGICINLITSDHELEDLTRIQNYYNISMSEITNLEELEKMFEEMRKDTPSA